MNEERPTNSNRRPPEGEPVKLTFEDTERILLQRVADQKDNPRQAMWELAQFYKFNGRHDQALACLRDLMQRLPKVEQKAQCVFTMGQSAEKVGDFVSAVRYYKEALSMEPVSKFTWYFILNNLGFSLNRLGHYVEGETYCRKAIEVNGGRYNAHKNVGIALAGQGRYQEAAQHFVIATTVDAGDPRSLGLLRDLLQKHPELEYEFGPEVARCEQAVKFAALAIQRARAGKVLKILLGCNNQDLDEMFSEMFRCMAGGAVKIASADSWNDFIGKACAGSFDLGLCITNNLVRDENGLNSAEPWAFAVSAVRRIKGNSSMAIILSGDYNEVSEHEDSCLEAGADVVLELPFSFNALADAARRVLGVG